MATSSFKPTGHLKPREVVPESQIRAICGLASEGRGYRQIFAILRGLAPYDVTQSEISRFGTIARNRGCGTNDYRMVLTADNLNAVVAKVRKLGKEAAVKPTRRVMSAFLQQKERQAAQRRKNRRGGQFRNRDRHGDVKGER